MQQYVLKQLTKKDAPGMFDLIVQRIRWMDENGIRQWNVTHYDKAYPLSHYEEALSRGEGYGLINEAGEIICAARFIEEDECWEDKVPALYIHSFASKPGNPGAGAYLLHKAEEYARGLGKMYLRLDSAADNEALSRYYEKQGFMPCGTCEDGPYRGILRQKKL